MDKLERVYKKFLKEKKTCCHIQTAVYILTETIPIEAVVHKRALTLYGSISWLSDNSVEKQLARRQLSVKNFGSNSW